MKDDDVTFEPLDKLDILKEEMAKKFKGMDVNLEKIQSLQEPIANAKPRMKSRMDSLTQGVLDIRPFIPRSFTLFHGIADVLQAIDAPAKAQAAREQHESDRDLSIKFQESAINRDKAFANFLDNWKMPPESAVNFAMSGQAMSQTMQAPPSLGSPARPPGPASAVVTPPYAGVLAGGSSAGFAANTGGSELRDILGVLREILDAIRQLKSQGGDEETEDESETVENRRPQLAKKEEPKPPSVIKEAILKSEPLPSVDRPPQNTATSSITNMQSLVNAAVSLAAP